VTVPALRRRPLLVGLLFTFAYSLAGLTGWVDHVGLTWLSGVSIARAQLAAPTPPVPVAGEPAGYRAAVDGAIAEYEAGNFAESRALFARAHALFPNARSLRGLGMTDFELRNYAASIDFLQSALASPVKALDGELRVETEALLTRARGFVGRFRLVLQPPDAAVTLDGALLPPPVPAQLLLAVGDHALEVGAQGYASERRTLRVTGGEDLALEFVLPAQGAIPPAALEPTVPRAQSSSSIFSSPWFWTAAGVVVVGAAVGIGVAASSGGTTREAAADSGSSKFVLNLPN
jgi:hypothetical protein